MLRRELDAADGDGGVFNDVPPLEPGPDAPYVYAGIPPMLTAEDAEEPAAEPVLRDTAVAPAPQCFVPDEMLVVQETAEPDVDERAAALLSFAISAILSSRQMTQEFVSPLPDQSTPLFPLPTLLTLCHSVGGGCDDSDKARVWETVATPGGQRAFARLLMDAVADSTFVLVSHECFTFLSGLLVYLLSTPTAYDVPCWLLRVVAVVYHENASGVPEFFYVCAAHPHTQQMDS